MRVMTVVRDLKSASIRVVVDVGGTTESVRYTWESKDGEKAPLPEGWKELVLAEIEDQRSRSEGSDIIQKLGL